VTSDHFAKVPEWVLYAPIPDRSIRLYAVLQRYTRGRRAAWPAKTTLAAHMHCSVRAVERATDDLIAIGAAALVSPIGAPNRYRLFEEPTFLARPVGRRKRATCDTNGEGGNQPPATPMAKVEAPTCDTSVVPPATDSTTTCDSGVAQKESKEEGELLKESARVPSSRARTRVQNESKDDDGEEVSVRAVMRLVTRRRLSQRNEEVAGRGRTDIIPMHNGYRVDRWIDVVLERPQPELESIVRTYVRECPGLTLDEIAAAVSPDLVDDDLPADLDDLDEWMAQQRETSP
jgi:hypothetical protein